METPTVRKLRADALDDSVRVATLLRAAKVIATKLDLDDALDWIDKELSGYSGVATIGDLPAYRVLSSYIEARNPYHPWQPIVFNEPEVAEAISHAGIPDAMGALEGDGKPEIGVMCLQLCDRNRAELLRDLGGTATDVRRVISTSGYNGIMVAVRNRVLEWALELEKAGIEVEGAEREAAQNSDTGATQQFHAQNINLFSRSTVGGDLTISQSAALDIDTVQAFVTQARSALDGLPEELRAKLGPSISDLETEIGKQAPGEGRVRALLCSIRTICEGAVGNVTAHGIVALIGKML